MTAWANIATTVSDKKKFQALKISQKEKSDWGDCLGQQCDHGFRKKFQSPKFQPKKRKIIFFHTGKDVEQILVHIFDPSLNLSQVSKHMM